MGEFEISGSKKLHPTPDILDALEKDYPLEASIADLVDNSIDAGATIVLIRFMRRGTRLTRLCVVDNGRGMNETEIDRAMQFAAKRKYSGQDLGMFGVGLKTASLSQADSVTVLSCRKGGIRLGRQWTKAGIKKRDWSVNLLTTRSVEKVLAHDWGPIGPIRAGTVIQWDGIYDFDRLRNGIDAYLERAKVQLQHHLGLTLHRFLERGQLAIYIDVEDLESGEVGPPSSVTALNPFPEGARTGVPGYPKTYTARVDGVDLHMKAHIWRKKSKDQGYKLGGGRVAEHQGLYFYRHGRLIQDGGWNGFFGTNEPHLSLARVEIDIPSGLAGYLRVRSNKAGVDVPASFTDALTSARAKGGGDFSSYLGKAQEVYRARSEQKAKPLLRPGNGVPAAVKEAMQARDVTFLKGESCAVVWGKIPGTTFVEVDRDSRTVTLNAKYRTALLRGARGSKTDLPLVRTLLYFVFESAMAGDRIGRSERLRIEAIQAAMDAAFEAEQTWLVG
jgi:hypothetical protein